MYRIALINMPFGGLHIPSLGLTQLKAALEKKFGEQVEVDIMYISHDFGQYFGIDVYQYLSDDGISTVTGLTDWLFREVAFPDLEDNAEAYLGRYRYSFAFTDEQMNTLLQKRARLDQYFDQLIDEYQLDQYFLVGFTSMFDQMMSSFAMARKVRERNPDVVTVMGGASCELTTGEIVAKKIDAIDFVFSGPALKSFPQFAGFVVEGEMEKCHQLQGVFTRQNLDPANGKMPIVLGEETDINERLPLDYDSFLASLEAKCPELKPELFFETSRGCWWGEKAHCTFCGLNGITMKYRTMSARNALDQFRELFQRYPEAPLFFAVDNILDTDYFETVFPYIKVPENSNVFYETKVITDEKQMQILAEAGVTVIQPGLEALSSQILKLLKKGTTAFQNVNFLKSSLKYGITPDWNLLIGVPLEAEDVYKKYVADIPNMVHLPPPGATFPIRFDRYSPYHKEQEKYQLELKPLDFYSMIYPFTEEEVEGFAYFFADHNYDNKYMLHLARWRKKVEAVIAFWIERWQDDKNRPELKLIPGTNRIYDSRSGEVSEYEISPLGLWILKTLHRPLTITRLMRLMEKEREELEEQIAVLNQHNLLFQEGDRMLSLVSWPDDEKDRKEKEGQGQNKDQKESQDSGQDQVEDYKAKVQGGGEVAQTIRREGLW